MQISRYMYYVFTSKVAVRAEMQIYEKDVTLYIS